MFYFTGACYQGAKRRELTVSRDSGNTCRVLSMVRLRCTTRRSFHTNAKLLGLRSIRISTRVVHCLSKEKTGSSAFDIIF